MATRTKTPEQRARWAEYMRMYRALHPEKMRMYRANRIRREALKLLEQMQADGGSGGRD